VPVVTQSRTVVITEASSPVALATAARLSAGGDVVLLGSRRTGVCEEFAARLRSVGAAVFAAHLDLADLPSVDRFVDTAEYLVGTPDVLVSAAGLTDGSWTGAQHLVAQLVPPMIDNRRGDVVLLSPELVGSSPPGGRRMLEAWARGLDVEFIGRAVHRAGSGGRRELSDRRGDQLIGTDAPTCRRHHPTGSRTDVDAGSSPSMRLEVDVDRCTGHGICESIADDVFEVQDDGTLIIDHVQAASSDPDRLQLAVIQCPAAALRLLD